MKEERQRGQTTHGFSFLGRGASVLMLFDAPRIGFDYSLNVYKGFSLNASYTYWLGGGVINNFYNLFSKRQYSKDFYGSNTSVGISYALFKEKE